MFLNFLDESCGISREEYKTPKGRMIRNQIDLLSFALERNDDEKVKFYTAELCEIGEMHPVGIVVLFERCQYAHSMCTRKYYKLILHIMNNVEVKFQAEIDNTDPLESVPMFLACIGAEIQRAEPELYEEFIHIGR